jgi:hypothetical protein
MISDSELISRIKEQADNAATLELINRHSGVYIDVINQYAFSPKIQMPELKDDRMFNIFSWIKTFDPTKETQFGSYVGKKTRWMCLNIINRDAESVEMDVNSPNTDMDTQGAAEMHSDAAEVSAETAKIDDPVFWRIFKLRFDGKRPKSWRSIGEQINLSHEGARKHFLKHIGAVREQLAV